MMRNKNRSTAPLCKRHTHTHTFPDGPLSRVVGGPRSLRREYIVREKRRKIKGAIICGRRHNKIIKLAWRGGYIIEEVQYAVDTDSSMGHIIEDHPAWTQRPRHMLMTSVYIFGKKERRYVTPLALMQGDTRPSSAGQISLISY